MPAGGKLAGYEEPAMRKCALRWMKYFYEKNNMGVVNALETMLSSGEEFTRLIVALSKKQIPEIPISKIVADNNSNATTYNPLISPIAHFSRGRHNTISAVDTSSPNQNIIASNLYYLRAYEGIPLKNVTASGIANGHSATIVKVVWCLFSKYILSTIISDTDGLKRNTPKEIMMEYFRGLEKYIKIKNLRAIQDGVTLCALVFHYHPELLDFSSLVKENKAQNNRNAFTFLVTNLKIPALIDFSDLIDVKTSDRALMFFTAHCIHFLQNESKEEEQFHSCTTEDYELLHLRRKMQIIEKRIELLSGKSEKLANNLDTVVSSATAAENKSFQSSMEKEMEVQNHIIHLEMKIGKMMALVHEQASQINELLEKQDDFDKIWQEQVKSSEALDEATLREKYALLLLENRSLREHNDRLLKQHSEMQLTPSEKKRTRSDAALKTRRTESNPPKANPPPRRSKTTKSNTIHPARKKKTGASIAQSSIGFLAHTLDKGLKRIPLSNSDDSGETSPILDLHEQPLRCESLPNNHDPKLSSSLNLNIARQDSSDDIKTKKDRRAGFKRAASHVQMKGSMLVSELTSPRSKVGFTVSEEQDEKHTASDISPHANSRRKISTKDANIKDLP